MFCLTPILLAAVAAACDTTQVIGYVDSEANSGDADTETSDSDDSRDNDDNYHRVSFVPTDNSHDEFDVPAQDNELDLPGYWDSYSDFRGSDGNLSIAVPSILCSQGQVDDWDDNDDEVNYSGFRILLCYGVEDEDDDWSSADAYTLGNCPFTDNLQRKIVGVSFQIEGDLPDDLKLYFYESAGEEAAFFPVVSNNRTDYLFEDVVASSDNDEVDVFDVSSARIEIRNAGDDPLNFHLCVRDFALLVKD